MQIKYIDKIIWLLVRSIVLMVPVSFYLFLGNEQSKYNFSVRISIADLLVLIAFSVLILKVIFYRKSFKLKFPEQALSFFMLAIILSVVQAESTINYIKELIQVLLNFYILYLVLINSNLSTARSRKLIIILMISCCCIVPFAIYQFYVAKQDPYFIRGLFTNRNIYGFFLAATIPLMLAFLYDATNTIKRLGWALLTGISLFSMLAFGHVLAAFSGILVSAGLKGKKYLIWPIIGLSCYVVSMLFFAPNQSIQEFRTFACIYEQDAIKERIRQVWHYNDAPQKGVLLSTIIDNQNLIVANDLFIPQHITQDTSQSPVIHKKHTKNILKQYYTEWMAALNLLSTTPFTGCGLGNYQDKIGIYYGHLPKNNTSEPNFRNGYMVLAASTGLLGLLTFLFLFYRGGVKLVKSILSTPRGKTKNLHIGLLGSLVAIVISNFFTPVFNAQIITIAVLILFFTNHYIPITNEP